MKVRHCPEEVLDELRRISAEVLKEESERSPLAKEIYDSFMTFKKRSEAYQAVSEEAYMEAR